MIIFPRSVSSLQLRGGKNGYGKMRARIEQFGIFRFLFRFLLRVLFRFLLHKAPATVPASCLFRH